MKSYIPTKVKAALTGAAGLALASGVSAYQFTGMQNLSDFVSDMVALIPSLIPLVVILAIITVVYAFRNFLTGALRLK